MWKEKKDSDHQFFQNCFLKLQPSEYGSNSGLVGSGGLKHSGVFNIIIIIII